MNDLTVRIGLEDDVTTQVRRVRREIEEELKKLATSRARAEQDEAFREYMRLISEEQKAESEAIKKSTAAVKKSTAVWREKTRVLLPVMFFANKMAKSFGWLQENIKKTYHAGELFSIQQMIMSDYMDTWMGQIQSDVLVWFADFLADHPNVSAWTGAVITVGGWTGKIVDFAASLALIKWGLMATNLATVGTTAATVATSVGGITTAVGGVKTALTALVTSPWVITLALSAAGAALLIWLDKLAMKKMGYTHEDYGRWESTVGAGIGTSAYNIFDVETGEMRTMTIPEILEVKNMVENLDNTVDDLQKQGINVNPPTIKTPKTPEEIVAAAESKKNEAGEVVISAPTASEAEDIKNTLELLGYSLHPFDVGLPGRWTQTPNPYAVGLPISQSTSTSNTYNYNMTSQSKSTTSWGGTTNWGDLYSGMW